MHLKKSIFRLLSHVTFSPGRAKSKFLEKYCSRIRNKKILEIGSGKRVNGKLKYSVADYFRKNSNEIILSDINPRYGHKIVDITKSVPKGFDVIICLNVLEHVFDFHNGVKNLHKSLKNNGQLMILVPAFYPLHDEPQDYWRFTEHSLKKLLSIFKKVQIEHYGKREYPFFYFVVATK
jgi:SAM-dependent methyltransferase